MRRLYVFLILSAFLSAFPAAAFAQAELHHNGDTLGVSANGREVLTITDKGNNRMFIEVGGFILDLEGRGRQHDGYRPQRKPRVYYTTINDFRFGFIGLTTPDYSMYDDSVQEFLYLDNARSISFSFNYMAVYPLSGARRTFLSFGLRPRWNNYVFSERITLENTSGMVHPLELDMRRLEKSKLTTFSLDVPVMFKVRTPDKKLFFEGGVYGGLTLRHFTKVKFPKSKDRADLGVNFFNAGATLRVKYNWIGIFADYSFTPLFKRGAGPRTNPFIIGITL